MAFLDELAVREAAMKWLDSHTQFGNQPVRAQEIAGFTFASERVQLIGTPGIIRPKQLQSALSIRTTWTPQEQRPPYEDRQGTDGLMRYKYQGDDPENHYNRDLRRAFHERLPMIWFVPVEQHVYLARYPVYVVADEPHELQVALAIDDDQLYLGVPQVDEGDRRSNRSASY